jgi:hypothetical protein
MFVFGRGQPQNNVRFGLPPVLATDQACRPAKRFGIGRVCVVADRGMINAASLAALEERGLEYTLGVRERSTACIGAEGQ